MAINALKKITIRDVLKGKPEMVTVKVPNAAGGTDDKAVAVAADLVLLYGRAINHRIGTTPLGEFMEYLGSFEARRIKDGEIFQSSRIIFPPIAADMAQSAYLMAKKGDDSAMVDLSFVVGVEPDPTGITGYKYTCKPIRTGAADSDPLAELRSSLGMQFVEILGADAARLMGLPIPGEEALKIEHHPDTGEVIEGTAVPKGRKKAEATA